MEEGELPEKDDDRNSVKHLPPSAPPLLQPTGQLAPVALDDDEVVFVSSTAPTYPRIYSHSQYQYEPHSPTNPPPDPFPDGAVINLDSDDSPDLPPPPPPRAEDEIQPSPRPPPPVPAIHPVLNPVEDEIQPSLSLAENLVHPVRPVDAEILMAPFARDPIQVAAVPGPNLAATATVDSKSTAALYFQPPPTNARSVLAQPPELAPPPHDGQPASPPTAPLPAPAPDSAPQRCAPPQMAGVGESNAFPHHTGGGAGSSLRHCPSFQRPGNYGTPSLRNTPQHYQQHMPSFQNPPEIPPGANASNSSFDNYPPFPHPPTYGPLSTFQHHPSQFQHRHPPQFLPHHPNWHPQYQRFIPPAAQYPPLQGSSHALAIASESQGEGGGASVRNERRKEKNCLKKRKRSSPSEDGGEDEEVYDMGRSRDHSLSEDQFHEHLMGGEGMVRGEKIDDGEMLEEGEIPQHITGRDLSDSQDGDSGAACRANGDVRVLDETAISALPPRPQTAKPVIDLGMLKAAALEGRRKKLRHISPGGEGVKLADGKPESIILTARVLGKKKKISPSASTKKVPQVIFDFDESAEDNDDESEDESEIEACGPSGEKAQTIAGSYRGDGVGEEAEQGSSALKSAAVVDGKRAKRKELEDLRRKLRDHEESKKIASVVQGRSSVTLTALPAVKAKSKPSRPPSPPLRTMMTNNPTALEKSALKRRIAELEEKRKQRVGASPASSAGAFLSSAGLGQVEEEIAVLKGVDAPNSADLQILLKSPQDVIPPIVGGGSRRIEPDALVSPESHSKLADQTTPDLRSVIAPWNGIPRNFDGGVRLVAEKDECPDAKDAERKRLRKQLKALDDEAFAQRKADISHARSEERLAQAKKNVVVCRQRLAEALEEEAVCSEEARKTKKHALHMEKSFRRKVREASSDEDEREDRSTSAVGGDSCGNGRPGGEKGNERKLADAVVHSAASKFLNDIVAADENSGERDVSFLLPCPLTPNALGPYRSPLGILRPYVKVRKYPPLQPPPPPPFNRRRLSIHPFILLCYAFNE